MTQLFLTLREAEACAAECVELIDDIMAVDVRNRKWRAKLEHIRERLRVTVEEYGRTDWIEDDGGPYLKLFDALSFINQASRTFDYDRHAVQTARDLLASIAR